MVIRTRLRVMVAGAGAVAMAIGGGVWLTGTAAASARPATAHAARSHSGSDHGLDDQAPVLSARLAPSVKADPTVFGMMPGKIPWVIRSGHVRLGANGRVRATITGLVVPSTGKNPIPDIAAVVFCGGKEAGIAGPVPFSVKGNARIDAKVTLPAFCPAPAVLFEPAHGAKLDNMYIAFDGTATS